MTTAAKETPPVDTQLDPREACLRAAARLRQVYPDLVDNEDAALYYVVRDLEEAAGPASEDPIRLEGQLVFDPVARAAYIAKHGMGGYANLVLRAQAQRMVKGVSR